MASTLPDVRVHLGRNIEQIRELRGWKQSTLADKMHVTQQTISKIESSENVDDEKLEQVATALGVTAEAIKRFNGDRIINSIINDNHNNHDRSINAATYYEMSPTREVSDLYERML